MIYNIYIFYYIVCFQVWLGLEGYIILSNIKYCPPYLSAKYCIIHP